MQAAPGLKKPKQRKLQNWNRDLTGAVFTEGKHLDSFWFLLSGKTDLDMSVTGFAKWRLSTSWTLQMCESKLQLNQNTAYLSMKSSVWCVVWLVKSLCFCRNTLGQQCWYLSLTQFLYLQAISIILQSDYTTLWKTMYIWMILH